MIKTTYNTDGTYNSVIKFGQPVPDGCIVVDELYPYHSYYVKSKKKVTVVDLPTVPSTFVGKAWVPIISEQAIKAKRDRLLSETDWVITSAMETGKAIPEAILNYRQELRDITKQIGYPNNIVWPEKP